jgi:DHA2 family methylenomycin A resistance protein-like MFS transporter
VTVEATSAPQTPVRSGPVLATVTAAQVLSVASSTVVAVALPALARDLGAGGTEQQWVIDAFVLVFASLMIAGGVIGDRRGRRTAFVAGLFLFAVGSLACALAPTVEWLIAGRVIQAMGPALVLPASLAIITYVYSDPAARARAIGLWGAGSGLGLTLGPLLGGGIVDGLGWRWVFGLTVPACLLLAWLALRQVPRDRPSDPSHAFDGAAALLLTSAVALLVFGAIEGPELGWASVDVIGAFTVALVLIVAFVRRERRHPAPLVDLSLLRQRTFMAANLGGATLYGALTASAVYLSVFFQQIQGRSALEAGLCLLPQGALTAAFAPVSGRITARFGVRLPILTGIGIACVAVLGLVQIEPTTPIGDVWWAFALLGIGTGLALPPMTVTALAAMRPEQAGMASAIHNTCRQLGQTFAVAGLGTIIFTHARGAAGAAELQGPLAVAWVDGLRISLIVAAALLALAGLAVAVLVPRRVAVPA